ncbi:MAG: 16S rRNA (cytosine(1402)-N(4))-methyltransferase RsmH [Rickettsiales bacterium]|nr:16S rRNA (cytosine(1402)-N(4))-methyltransferase RsmH [Rickettsiales bacterium]
MVMNKEVHTPVLLEEVISYLNPCNEERYIDCTFGNGGYSKAILEKANAIVYGFDLDPEAYDAFIKTKKKLNKKAENLYFFQCNFAELESKLAGTLVDGIVADLGVSSMQIDKPDRGFSFQKEGPLDMRMSQSGLSAYDVVNDYSEEELADIIYKYGEENKARQIARAIVKNRQISLIKTTSQLAEIIRAVFKGKKRGKIDFATKTFQAIRIWINGEIDNLKKLLETSERILKEGGRLVIVSFHGLEDKVVKNFMRDKSNHAKSSSRYLPDSSDQNIPSFKVITRKPIVPNDIEIKNNVRARSAKLRAAIRINRGKESVW